MQSATKKIALPRRISCSSKELEDPEKQFKRFTASPTHSVLDYANKSFPGCCVFLFLITAEDNFTSSEAGGRITVISSNYPPASGVRGELAETTPSCCTPLLYRQGIQM